MIILSQKFGHGGQDFEIFIKYDEVEKVPVEVKNIMLHTHGNWYPVGSIMTKFFKDAVWQLITQTNWEDVRKEMENDRNSLLRNIHPIMQEMLRPHLLPCGPVLNN
jgi:hypothetical protein